MEQDQRPEAGPETAEAAPAEPAAPPQADRVEELSRALADLINDREAFKRRLERERDRQLEAQRYSVASALLEAVDELERALAAGARSPKALEDGVRLIAEGLSRRLDGLGLSRIAVQGERFDPQVHEAVDVVPVPDPEAEGRVVSEVRPGWRAGEKVIRPARVRVGRFDAKADPVEPGTLQ